MAKPKVGDTVQIIKFGGVEKGEVVEYNKESDIYTVVISGHKWTRVPYKLPKNFNGPLYIEKTI